MADKQKNVLGEDLEECSINPLTGWYAKALEAGKGCPIYLKKTHKNTLKLIPIETLKKFAIDLS